MKTNNQSLFTLLVLAASIVLPKASAQVTNVVFSEGFSGSLNTNKWIVGTRTLEGGTGTIVPTVSNGVVEITGTTTEQWWAGGSLQVATNFTVNAETNVVFSADRVSETGSGTAHRTALWILDSTGNYFVLFAEDVGETEWEFNRKIGLSGDVPTGSGTAIGAFDAAGSPYLDGALHTMKAVCDGSSAKLYLDGVFGVSVPFPFNNVAFALGSLARANNDVADTTFSNVLVETVGMEAFSPSTVTILSGQSASNVVVRIPPGANKTQDVQVTVTSDTPSVAFPGPVNGSLVLTFAAGATNVQTLPIKSAGLGGAIFSMTNDIGMGTANSLSVVVLLGAGVRLTDDFSGTTIDTNKWQVDTNGFEPTGVGTFNVSQTNGTLVINGNDDQLSYWPGIALETAQPFTATTQLPLVFDVDRVSIDPTSSLTLTPSTGARTGVFITTADHSKFVFFGQDLGETGWEVNVNPGTPTGSGTAITQFSSLNDTNAHHIKLVADGSQVEVFLDGQSGGKFSFPVTAGIHFELGAYARAVGDSVNGVFDNVQVENILPPITVTPTTIETPLGVNTNVVTITAPQLRSTAIGVTITSQNPNVAIPQGAVNGALTLQFPAGGTNLQAFNVVAVGIGQTSFVITNNQSVPVNNGVAVTVVTPSVPWFSDTFSTSDINSNNWTLDATPLVAGGTSTNNSGVFVTNNQVEMAVTCASADWPGFALLLTTSVTASVTSPVSFEIDRTKMQYVLVGGTSVKERTGVWVKDPTTNYVFFNDFDTHDGTAGGWQYNDVIGSTNDTPLPGGGIAMTPLDLAALNDLGNHRLKVEVNGITAKLYVDGILGGAAPFPFTNGIVFGAGTYVNYGNNGNNIVEGFYDNALLSGPSSGSAKLGPLAAAKQADGTIKISWTGAGVLQESSSPAGGWTDVSPVPTGTTFTVTPTGNSKQFFRLR